MNMKLLILLATFAFMLTGCGSQKKVINAYYLIEKPDIPYAYEDQQPLLEGYCEISTVEIFPAFASQKIAIRRKSSEIIYYNYHHWAERPDVFFSLMLVDHFSHAPVFKGVSAQYRGSVPEYTIQTTINKLEVVEANKSMSAHLSLEFLLTDNKNRETLVRHSADRTQIMDKKDLNLFAETIGKMFYDDMKIFSDKIVEQIRDTSGK